MKIQEITSIGQMNFSFENHSFGAAAIAAKRIVNGEIVGFNVFERPNKNDSRELRYKTRFYFGLYGIDGTPEIKALIGRNQMIVGTVAQSPIKMGQIAVENMYNILNGKKIEKNIIIPISLINKENLFKYDEDRWQ